MANREYSRRMGWVKLDLAGEVFGYWERQEFTQLLSGNVDVLDSIMIRTTTGSAVNVYVDNSRGSDTYPGTSARPLATIQAAIDMAPEYFSGPVLISVATGTYSGAYLDGPIERRSANTNTATGVYYAIVGSMVTASVQTGQAFGTASNGTSAGSGQTFAAIVDPAQNLTTSDVKGKVCYITSGARAGQFRLISDNTSGTLNLVGSWSGLASGDTYVIKDWGTVISTGVVVPSNSPDAEDSPGTIQYSFQMNTSFGTGRAQYGVILEQMSLQSQRCLNYDGEGNLTGRLLQFKPTTAGTVINSNGAGLLRLRYCDLPGTQAGSQNFYRQSIFSEAAHLNMIRCRISGTSPATNAVVQSVGGPAFADIQVSELRGFQYGAQVQPGSQITFLNNRISGLAGAVGSGKVIATAGFSETGGIDFGTVMTFYANQIDSCGIVADAGPGMAARFTQGNTGGGNTTVYKLRDGARVSISSAETVSGSTDIDIDGATISQTNFRLLNPVSTSSLSTFSRIWQA